MTSKHVLLSALTIVSLVGCKQELPAKLSAPAVFGSVQEVTKTDNEETLVYAEGEDPYKKNWGKAGNFYVTVEGKKYMLFWDQADKFKKLKVGDKVNLHPSEYIGCLGQNDLKPVCYGMMRVYRNEVRVNPIEIK